MSVSQFVESCNPNVSPLTTLGSKTGTAGLAPSSNETAPVPELLELTGVVTVVVQPQILLPGIVARPQGGIVSGVSPEISPSM